ncbi:SLC13 family permease [Microbulbifer hydrolyticus]|uniref:Di/tricarboxylate transporter n=1 Tax=Microbulbifer hydrolyticus TaxID=48074 RepID=A0A6P1TDU2_9GAMM|nr:SLC13 family permease [Microbulbifer hydrolyticus]MBB5212570.1 di/tricarboxylate transporter [Microbulbifer hydrolyticus]QHQ40187.1 SLC13 family permease [Microbulbifer hydrolyticus]
MTLEQIAILLILAVTVVLFIWGPWRHDMVALASLLACVFTGLIEPVDAFTGFGHPAVVTVACVLILSRGLQNTGAMDALAQKVVPKRGGITLAIAALTALGAGMSGFMNNVGAMALLMPVATDLADRYELPPGKVLMPLSFGTILGGMTTLIGTPPNLIVSGFRASAGAGSYGMFDFTPVGVVVALVGIVFVSLIGWRLVPARTQAGAASFDTGTYLTEALVGEKSAAVGKSLAELVKMIGDEDAQVIGLVHNNARVSTAMPGLRVRTGDILVIESEPESLSAVLSNLGLTLAAAPEADEKEKEKAPDKKQQKEDGAEASADDKDAGRNGGESEAVQEPGSAGNRSQEEALIKQAAELAGGRKEADAGDMAIPPELVRTEESAGSPEPDTGSENLEAASSGKKEQTKEESDERQEKEKRARAREDLVLRELVVMPDSFLIGRSAENLRLAGRYEINLLALSRKGRRSVKRLRSTPLMAGDALLMMGTEANLRNFANEQHCVPLAQRDISIPNKEKAYVALVAMALAVAGAAFGLLPAAISFATCALAFMALKVVPLRNVYEAIDGSVIVLLGALIAVAGVMESTGAADVVAKSMLDNIARGNPVIALVLILVVTMTLSDFMNNAATAAVMCAIALSAAGQLDVNPDSFLMAVAIGASCAFLTPVGHQNNTLILGPGGFNFGDYWPMGLPMEVLVVAVAVPMLLWVWPL